MSDDFIIYLIALSIGVFLGLMGNGTSILIVPILVYIASVTPMLSTTYSLFFVGITSLVSMFTYLRRNLVNFREVSYYLVPSVLTTFIIRKLAFFNIPIIIFQNGNFILLRHTLFMVGFAILMLIAAISMIIVKRDGTEKDTILTKSEIQKLIIIGIITGLVTSLTGTGCGFIIVPTLVFLGRFTMKKAIGTSLFVTAVNTLVGFGTDLTISNEIDWHFLLLFTAMAVAGIMVGNSFSRHVSGTRLRIIFGYLLVCAAFFIVIREIIF